MKRIFPALVALLTLGSAFALVPSQAGAAPVATGYSSSEYRDFNGAANYLGVEMDYLQRFGVRTIHFLIALTGKLGQKGQNFYNDVVTNGPFAVTSDYVGEDLESILVVMDFHTVTASQAQKIGAAFMTFISGIDAANKGINIELFKENAPGDTTPPTTAPTTTQPGTPPPPPPDPCSVLPNDPAQCGYALWQQTHQAALAAVTYAVDNMACVVSAPSGSQPATELEIQFRQRLVPAINDLPAGDNVRAWLEASRDFLNNYRANCVARNWSGWYGENWGFDAAYRARVVAQAANVATLGAPDTTPSDPFPLWYGSMIATRDVDVPANVDCAAANANSVIQKAREWVTNYTLSRPIRDAVAADPAHPANVAFDNMNAWAANNSYATVCPSGAASGVQPLGLRPLADAAISANAGLSTGSRDGYLLPMEKPYTPA